MQRAACSGEVLITTRLSDSSARRMESVPKPDFAFALNPNASGERLQLSFTFTRDTKSASASSIAVRVSLAGPHTPACWPNGEVACHAIASSGWS